MLLAGDDMFEFPEFSVFHAKLFLAFSLTCSLVACGDSNSTSSPPSGSSGASGSVVWKKGSTTPLMQITGDTFQFFVNGSLNFYPTAAKTVSNSGAAGTDLGIPVSFPGEVVLLWGDTTPVYPAVIQGVGPGYYLADAKGNDSIGVIPDMDLGLCSAIPTLYQQLVSGSSGSMIDYGQCPTMTLFNQTNPPPQTALFQPITISGLGPNEDTGFFEVPTGAFNYNNNLYMFYTVTVLSDLGLQYDPNRNPNYPITSILAKSTTTSNQWTAQDPPTFVKLYDASAIPASTITTPPYSLDNPPPEISSPGKFIFVSPRLLQSSAISHLPWFSGLPPPIREAPEILFLLGGSWRLGDSNMYLSVVSSQDIEATNGAGGPDSTKWWYYAGSDRNGNPQWSHNEVDALPLISEWAGGQHAMMWIPELNHFIVHYQDQGLQSRSSFAPWGPWTTETVIFTKDDPTWGTSIGHHPGQDAITKFAAPPLVIYNKSTGKPIDQDPTEAAFIYGGYCFDRYTVNADGSVTFYCTVSTRVPYGSFLMKTVYCLDLTSQACAN